MLENKSCDLLIYGADPGGVSCAIRAARNGTEDGNELLVLWTLMLAGAVKE